MIFVPRASARLPVATDDDLEVLVFCSEGYTPSLAAAALQDLVLWRATSLVDFMHGVQQVCLVPPSEASQERSP